MVRTPYTFGQWLSALVKDWEPLPGLEDEYFNLSRSPHIQNILNQACKLWGPDSSDSATANRISRWLCADHGHNPESARRVTLAVLANLLRGVSSEVTGAPKGTPGRRGYPEKTLRYAHSLRTKNPELTIKEIRAKCLKKFDEHDLPPDIDSFRRWLNRKRKNGRIRAN